VIVAFRGSLAVITVVFAAVAVESVHLGFSEEINFGGLKEFSLVIGGTSFEGFGVTGIYILPFVPCCCCSQTPSFLCSHPYSLTSPLFPMSLYPCLCVPLFSAPGLCCSIPLFQNPLFLTLEQLYKPPLRLYIDSSSSDIGKHKILEPPILCLSFIASAADSQLSFATQVSNLLVPSSSTLSTFKSPDIWKDRRRILEGS